MTSPFFGNPPKSYTSDLNPPYHPPAIAYREDFVIEEAQHTIDSGREVVESHQVVELFGFEQVAEAVVEVKPQTVPAARRRPDKGLFEKSGDIVDYSWW